MTQYIWLTIALPIVGVLFNGILGRRVGYKVVRFVGPLMVLLSFLVGVGAIYESALRDGEPVTVTLWTWATIGDFNVNISLLVDPLSLLMVLVVTGVGFLIHVYATDYMIHRDNSGHAHPDRLDRDFSTLGDGNHTVQDIRQGRNEGIDSNKYRVDSLHPFFPVIRIV